MIVLARPDLDVGELVQDLERNRDRAVIDRYETAVRQLLGLSRVYAVDSGRSAIVVALRASAVKGRDQVIVPSFICPAVIDAIRAAGGTVVLADSDPGTPNVSASHVAELIGRRTHAVIVPHVFGVPAPVAPISELARSAGAVLIEDCAHAVGATAEGRPVGHRGDFAVFSTNFDKPFTTGFGGVLAVNDGRYVRAAEAALRTRVDDENEEEHFFGLLLDLTLSRQDLYRRGVSTGQGRAWLRVPHIRALYRRWREGLVRQSEFDSAAVRLIEMDPIRKRLGQRVLSRFGVTGTRIAVGRLGALRAAVGLVTLAAYPDAQARRQRNAALYTSLLCRSNNVSTIACRPGDEPQWLRYAVIARDVATAREITARAADAGYRVGNANWPAAIHEIPRYRRIARFDRPRNAEELAARIINLPLHGEVGEPDVRTLAAVIAASGADAASEKMN